MTSEQRNAERIAGLSRKARLWDRSRLKSTPEQIMGFTTADQTRYAVHPTTGAFIQVNKDRRSVKARKRARRQARTAAA